jgi:hypothetical protein
MLTLGIFFILTRKLNRIALTGCYYFNNRDCGALYRFQRDGLDRLPEALLAI